MRPVLVSWLLLGASLSAQTESSVASPFSSPVPAHNLRASAGLVEEAPGRFLAGGADYRARVDAHGLVFEPALGRGVPVAQSLALSLRGIERGGAALDVFAAGSPAAQGLALEEALGAGVTERFDVRPEGIELSYRFDAPPPGAGDLVVRLGLATTLPRPADGPAAELAFRLPDAGGVTVGGVLGIDADGRTQAGSLRLAGDELALVLPAAFVDEASYPLVLDPLIGPKLVVSGSSNDDTRPDAAFDKDGDVYLVVWQRVFSAADSDIRGQRIAAAGGLVGSTIFFGSADVSHSPAVADLAARDRFAVTWIQDNQAPFLNTHAVKVQFVEADTGALSSVSTAASSFSDLIDADVCGEGVEGAQAGAEVDLVIVYDDLGNDEIRLVHGSFDAGDVLAWDAPKTVFTDDPALFGFYSQPAIARASGVYGRTLITVRRALLLSNATVSGYIVNIDGTVTGPGFAISDGAYSANAPDVDGFDRQWTAAWEASEGSDNRIEIAPISLDVSTGVATVGDAVPVSAPLLTIPERPAVGFSSGKSWIAWRQTNAISFTTSVVLQGFDSLSCTSCEGTFIIDFGFGEAVQWTAVATPTSGGAYWDDRGLLTWSIVGTAAGDIKAQMLHNNQQLGSTSNIGGGCGAGGTVQFSAPPSIGSSWWYTSVVGLPPDSLATIVNFSFADPSTSLACGTCAWMPFGVSYSPPLQVDPLQGKVASGVTILPCNPALVGAKLTVQWTTLTPSSSPCSLFPGFALSDRYRVTIGN